MEKERMFAWAKTLLSVYRYLHTVSDAIDNLVSKQCLNSAFCSVGNNSALSCANKVINLNYRKQVLVNAKVLVENAMERLPEGELQLLTLTYFDLHKSTTVSEALGCSLRTFFRRKNVAITKFANALKFLGFSSQKLEASLQGETWLVNLYHKHLSSESTEEEFSSVSDYKLLKFIINDLNKTTGRKIANS